MNAGQQVSEVIAQLESTAQGRKLTKYALIAGQHVVLPDEAKFYFQDKRGCWFWSNRKPRVKDGDWTPNKSPVQINNEKGFHRCLITPTNEERRGSWRDTVMRVINLDNMPLALSQ